MELLGKEALVSRTSIWGLVIATYGAVYYFIAIHQRPSSSHKQPPPNTSSQDGASKTKSSSTLDASNARESSTEINPKEPLSALQQHILFWDQDNDGIIWPHDVYNGFRAIGFNIPFSLTSLLIPVFFSYPTTLGHSIMPDPWFRIWVKDIHKAKHGSDSGTYDLKGNLKLQTFDDLFKDFDVEGRGSLGVKELWSMVKRNRVAADPAGWTFAMMEWGTTWLLLQRNGRVQKDDLKGNYEGALFWKLSAEREERAKGEKAGEERGYGVWDGLRDLPGIMKGWWGGMGVVDSFAKQVESAELASEKTPASEK